MSLELLHVSLSQNTLQRLNMLLHSISHTGILVLQKQLLVHALPSFNISRNLCQCVPNVASNMNRSFVIRRRSSASVTHVSIQERKLDQLLSQHLKVTLLRVRLEELINGQSVRQVCPLVVVLRWNNSVGETVAF